MPYGLTSYGLAPYGLTPNPPGVPVAPPVATPYASSDDAVFDAVASLLGPLFADLIPFDVQRDPRETPAVRIVDLTDTEDTPLETGTDLHVLRMLIELMVQPLPAGATPHRELKRYERLLRDVLIGEPLGGFCLPWRTRLEETPVETPAPSTSNLRTDLEESYHVRYYTLEAAYEVPTVRYKPTYSLNADG